MEAVYAMLSFIVGCIIGFVISIPSWFVMINIMGFFGDKFGTGNWLDALIIIPVFTLIGGLISAHFAQKSYARRIGKFIEPSLFSHIRSQDPASSTVNGVTFRKLNDGTHIITKGPYRGETFPSQGRMLNFVLQMRR